MYYFIKSDYSKHIEHNLCGFFIISNLYTSRFVLPHYLQIGRIHLLH